MAEDDDAVRARMAALEAELKAESATKAAAKQAAAKQAAIERLRAQKATKDAERQALIDRQTALVKGKKAPARDDGRDDDDARPARGRKASASDDIEGALELARKARGVKEELSRPRAANEKSWLWSGGLSLVLGPLGWLYAGSFREAIPASAAYLLIATILTRLPFMFVLMPAILIAMVISGFVGIFYAVQYNRHGQRTRLFAKDDEKALPPGR